MRRLVVILALLPACSFAFVSGPPANHAEVPYFTCTESRVAPVLDTIWTALMTLDVISLASESDAQWASAPGNNCQAGDPNCPVISRHGALALDAVLGVAGAAGMIYGYAKTASCRSAKAEAAARQQQLGPQPWGPQQGSWPPPQQGQPGTWPPPAHGTQAPQGPQTWPPQQPAPAPAPDPAPAPAPAPAP